MAGNRYHFPRAKLVKDVAHRQAAAPFAQHDDLLPSNRKTAFID
jgi:hypothetical protein